MRHDADRWRVFTTSGPARWRAVSAAHAIDGDAGRPWIDIDQVASAHRAACLGHTGVPQRVLRCGPRSAAADDRGNRSGADDRRHLAG